MSARQGVLQRLLSRSIRGYQLVTVNRQSPCRYWPTCSEYALQAVEIHGAWRGSSLALRRLGRCNPWGRSGVDPVPLASHALDSRCNEVPASQSFLRGA